MNLKLSFIALALGLSAAANASSQYQSENFYVDFNTNYVGKSKMKGNKDSSIQTSVSSIEIGNENFDIGFKRAYYKLDNHWWKDPKKMVVNGKSIYANLKYGDEISSNWSYMALLGVGANYSNGGVRFSKNYEYSGAAVFTYTFNPRWSADVGAGFAISKVDNGFAPVLNIKYSDISKPGFSCIIGFPTTQVAYRFNDVFAVKGALGMEDEIYGFVRGGKQAYFRDSYTTLDASVLANIGNFYAELGAGYVLNRESRLYDDKGKKFKDKIKYKRQATAFLNLGYVF